MKYIIVTLFCLVTFCLTAQVKRIRPATKSPSTSISSGAKELSKVSADCFEYGIEVRKFVTQLLKKPIVSPIYLSEVHPDARTIKVGDYYRINFDRKGEDISFGIGRAIDQLRGGYTIGGGSFVPDGIRVIFNRQEGDYTDVDEVVKLKKMKINAEWVVKATARKIDGSMIDIIFYSLIGFDDRCVY